MNKAKAIILGLYGANSLGNIRNLGEEDIPIIGVHKVGPAPHAWNSRYLTERYIVEDESHLLETLLHIGEGLDEKATLVCTGDDYVLFCGENAKELSQHFHVPISKNYPLETLVDKHDVLEIAQGAGFNVPNYCLLSGIENTRLTYPVLVKPLNSNQAGKFGMTICQSEKELLSRRAEILERFGDVVVEEYIPHEPEDLFSIHTYDLNGETITGMIVQKLRCFRMGDVLATSFLQSTDLPSLVDPSDHFTKEVAFSGPIDIDLIRRHGTDEIYFLEANYRSAVSVRLSAVAGINLSALHYFNMVGKDDKVNELVQRRIKAGVGWIDEAKDWQPFLLGDVPPLEYFGSLVKLGAFGIFDWRDPMPLLDSLAKGTLFFNPKRKK